MMKPILEGRAGQLGVGGILVVLVLQLVLPYVAGTATPDSMVTTADVTEMTQTLNERLRDLEEMGRRQCDADIVASTMNQRQVEAVTELTHAVATLSRVVDRLDRRLNGSGP